MIMMKNWRITVPAADKQIGYETETGVARLMIQMDDKYDGWQFKLDTLLKDTKNVFDFIHDGNIIYFDITEDLGLVRGKYSCQVRGEYGDAGEKRRLSNIFEMEVGASISAITVLSTLSLAELHQIEQRMTALKTEVENLALDAAGEAYNAEDEANRAKSEADRAAAIDAYTKSQSDVQLAGKADQPYETVSGESIYVTDSAGGRPAEIIISGNTVQDGTPMPDNPVEAVSVSGEIGMTVCGSNLINAANTEITQYGLTLTVADGYISAHGTATDRKTIYFARMVVPAGTYTVTLTADEFENANLFIHEPNNGYKHVAGISVPGSKTFALDVPTLISVGFMGTVGTDINISGARVMLQLGDTATPYEPYTGTDITIPLQDADGNALELCRTGDAVDTIECRGGVWGVNKAISSRTFDGTESWTKMEIKTDGLFRAAMVTDIAVSPEGCCNMFPWTKVIGSNNVRDEKFGGHAESKVITCVIRADRLASADIDGFKSWLAAKAAAGTPVTAYYQLAAPIWTTLSATAQAALDNIRLPAGAVNIFSPDAVPPGEIKMTYRQDLQAFVKNLHDKWMLDTAEQIINLQAQIDELTITQ